MKSKSRTQYKHAQLCAQVEDIASLALGSATDSRLNQLLVHSVTPSANGARLTIHVMSPDIRDFDTIDEVMTALQCAKAWLRQQIAEDINRKRNPDIDFQLVFVEKDEVP
jgi:ribosome-binding factor A